MSQLLSNWAFSSLSRKISGLSSLLLGFLFIVIVYSIIKLHQIRIEIREVSRIDIPLTEVISELEVLQLEKHILFEQVRYKTQKKLSGPLKLMIDAEREKLHSISVRVNNQLRDAEDIITQGIASGSIEEKLDEHQQMLVKLLDFKQQMAAFKVRAEQVFDLLHREDQESHWQSLELELASLDEQAISLVIDIEKLTKEIAENTERHETEFFYVNTALGISALIIGIYFTFYIISSFQRRVGQLQDDLENISQVITHGKKDGSTSKIEVKTDEFAGLAKSMNAVVERFSDELHNRYEIEHQLLTLAITDKLTGAYNRHKWDESLAAELKLAKRGAPLSMLLLDLDHFKSINDTYGHDIGDDVLVNMVTLIKSVVRDTDLVCRLGGEEFAVLVRNQSPQDAMILAEKLRAILANTKTAGLPDITTSIGVSHYQANDTVESFVKRADLAVYQAKENGRNQVVEEGKIANKAD